MLKTITTDAHTKIKNQEKVLVIDAGHGAFDPGKVGINQVLEKDVNLNISNKLYKLLKQKTIQVVLTRKDDTALGDTKMGDLKKRVNIINQSKADLAISIHQNSYTSESVKGAQVFYHKQSGEGKKVAEILQKELCSLDESNTRQAKADESYYLLKHTEVPLVIVECGFLSNQSEAQKLNTDEYQQKIAEAICSGILEYLKE